MKRKHLPTQSSCCCKLLATIVPVRKAKTKLRIKHVVGNVNMRLNFSSCKNSELKSIHIAKAANSNIPEK